MIQEKFTLFVIQKENDINMSLLEMGEDCEGVNMVGRGNSSCFIS
jgi:hypothetical protein